MNNERLLKRLSPRALALLKPAPPEEPPEATLLSPAQERFWLLHQWEPQLYTSARLLEIQGPLDRDRLQAALNALVARHEPLHTGIHLEQGELQGHPGPGTVELSIAGEDDREAYLAEPVDLGCAPLLRARLYPQGFQQHRLLLKSHHAVTDYAARDLMLRELAQLYRGEVLPDPVSHSTWVRQQQVWLQGAEAERQRAFWAESLRGATRVAVSGGSRKSYAGAHLRCSLPLEVSSQRLFSYCMACLCALLHERTGQTDLCIAFPLSQRSSPELDNIAGCLLNTVMLRTQVDPEKSFEQLWATVSEQMLTALEHGRLPLEQALEGLELPRPPFSSPLGNVMLNLLDVGQDWADWGDCSVRLQRVRRPWAALDLSFTLERRGAQVELEMEYATDLFSPKEARDLLDDYRRRLMGREFTLLELAREQARRSPEAVAFASQRSQLRFAELLPEIESLAGWLRQCGVTPGSTVAVYLDRDLPLPLVTLALLRAGAVFLLLDPNLPVQRLLTVVSDARATMVVSLHARPLPEFAGPTLFWEDRQPSSQFLEEPRSQQLAYLMYTSGSTGQPKGVAVTHANLAYSLRGLTGIECLARPQQFVLSTALSFDPCLVEMFLPLLTGGSCFLAESALLSESQSSVLQLTPSRWRFLLQSGWQPGPGQTIALVGGELLDEDLARRLNELFPEVWNLYGPTENTIWCTACRVDPERPARLGFPFAGVSARLINGELYLAGAQLAQGYWNLPDETNRRFLPNPQFAGQLMYRTGDRVSQSEDGQLEYLGRCDRQLKVAGVRVEPAEVEAVLRQVSGRLAAVQPAPDGQSLVAFLSGLPESREKLREALRRRLPDAMVPAQIFFVDEIPLNSNGKLDREALRIPQDELENRLLQVWRQVLDRPQMSAQEDFFQAGGHSLLAAELFRQIEKEFGSAPSLGRLLENPTVLSLTPILRDTLEPWPHLVVLQPGREARPPFFCVHPLGGDVLVYRKLSHLLGEDVPFCAFQQRDSSFAGVAICAERYVDELLRFFPEGPYLLGGLSLGGVIAYEMAARLQARGKKVRLVALLDTFLPRQKDGPSGRWRRLASLRFHVENLLWHCRAGQRWDYLKQLSERLGRSQERLPGRPNLWQDYTLPRSDAPVVLFQASHRLTPGSEPTEGWADYASNFRIRPIRGYHGSDLVELEPLARLLAAPLREEILKAHA